MTRPALEAFEGTWTYTREAVHDNGDVAVMDGRAVFSKAAHGLDYVETGVMRINGGAPLSTSQSYRWVHGLEIYFPDGRFFHAVPPAGAEATHLCDPDTYRVAYSFEDWPAWRTIWHVTGPRKAYRMATEYAKG